MLDIFSLCVDVEQSVAPNNSSTVVTPIARRPPHRTAPDTPTLRGDHLVVCGLWAVVCNSVLFGSSQIYVSARKPPILVLNCFSSVRPGTFWNNILN
jgi:hypothetical protein